jgi:nitric oxide reductase subunit B
MLAVGFAMFALRYFIPEDRWSDKLAAISFWSLNVGLAWMSLVTLLPLGVLQLYHSVDVGYYDARTLKFLTSNSPLEWLRLPGDTVFIVGGAVPLLWMTLQGVRHRRRHLDVLTEADLQLFTEVELHEPAEASAARSLG